MKVKMNRRKISQVLMTHAEQDSRVEHIKHYRCSTCSKAIRVEDIIRADNFRVIDPSGEVRYLVGYRFSCSDYLIEPFYDSRCSGTCQHGDNCSPENCSTCRYAIPYLVQIENDTPKIGKARKWAKPPHGNCTTFRTVYRCTNLIRMEQFNEGTFMCAYVKCDKYENKEGV